MSITPKFVPLYCLLVVVFTGPALPQAPAAEPVSLILDTDMGNDVDDAMTLSIIHALQSRGECRLLAVTVTKDNKYAARFVDMLNTFYGRGSIPIGVVRDGVTPEDGKYVRQVTTAEDNGRLRYPHDLLDGGDAPDAVALLRDVLAGEPDGSVVIAQVGFSTNLARLLESKPDRHSKLDGKALVKKKVSLLSIMAGAFSEKMRAERRKEYNIVKDLPSSKKLLAAWPTPIVASGWEIGYAIKHPSQSMREDYGYVAHHPLQDAYGYYRGLENDQPTYDLTSVVHAVRPDRNYFTLSEPGRIVVEEDGFTSFHPAADGPHRYMSVTPEQIAQVRELQATLCSQPPTD
jgi:inosine-uridine nucleoside N-ribohydrolase